MKELWIYHILALTLSFLLDRLVGDPVNLPHPIRWIGSLISFLEKKLKHNFKNGILLCVIVILVSTLVTGGVMYGAYRIHPLVYVFVEMIFSCYFLAAGSLYNESMKVYSSLKENDIEGARKNLSMIVGRDTGSLDEERVAKAAVETVAENTSDGVIAPFLYMAAGGPILGALYKAVNTMDSMVGYRNEKYEYFGKAAARLDDAFNFLPSRISAVLMILASFILGLVSKEYDGKRAFRIWRRDRLAHKSPNSAQTESVTAGALGGSSTYQGVLVEKPVIGDEVRKTEGEDILRANRLMFLTEDLAVILLALSLL